jgi:hypothetical protein
VREGYGARDGGYEAEVEAGVIAILDTIKELSETVGAYLADHAVTGVSHV